MLVNEAGKAVVLSLAYDPMMKRMFYQRFAVPDLKTLYMNRTVTIGTNKAGEPVSMPVVNYWLRHQDRRQYVGGIIFDPSGQHGDKDTLNLWRGFGVQPRQGSWGRLRDHCLNILCSGDRTAFEYLMGWMARLIQSPAEQGEVAVVMRGIEGTGKGTLARALLRLLAQHSLHISNAKHLVGNFNGHLRDCVFLFADEAFFAGDKQHVGVLKAIITEPTLTIEAKYANAIQVPNMLHIMMASNEEWVVPASVEARRFLVLNVSNARKGDLAYFDAIQAELNAGGYEAMLHDLMAYDLSRFNVRAVPNTIGLEEQKKLSLQIPQQWWLDVLHRGYVWKSKLGLDYFGEWHDTESTDLLFDSYIEYANARRDLRPMDREQFGKFMVEMKAAPTRRRNLVVGERLSDVRQAELIRKPGLSYGYRLGTLEVARAGFILATRLPVDWEGGVTDDDR